MSLTHFLDRPFGVEVLIQEVRRHRQGVFRVGGCLEFARRLGAQALPPETGRDGVATDRHPILLQVENQPGGA